MKSLNVIIILAIVITVIGTASAIKCYECNVWKAGYGHLCDNPRIRDDCLVCMKTETVVYMGYYKNTPRKSSTISRICAKSHTVHFSHECHSYQSSDGYNTRCYCDKDFCNSAPKSYGFTLLTIFPLILSLHKLLYGYL